MSESEGKRATRSWTAEINDAPPSNNVILRTHFRKRMEMRDVWYLHLYLAFFHTGITKAKGRRSVSIIITSTRQRDELNNALGADKFITDNLTRLGYIVDDSKKWIDLRVVGEVGTPRTVIEVSE